MAAAITGKFVVTSPNQPLIWETLQEGVYLRSDFRYGPHDPTLIPQPYIPEYPYLGAIPCKPMEEDDSLSIMWWNRIPTLVISYRPADASSMVWVNCRGRDATFWWT